MQLVSMELENELKQFGSRVHSSFQANQSSSTKQGKKSRKGTRVGGNLSLEGQVSEGMILPPGPRT